MNIIKINKTLMICYCYSFFLSFLLLDNVFFFFFFSFSLFIFYYIKEKHIISVYNACDAQSWIIFSSDLNMKTKQNKTVTLSIYQIGVLT